ncbi:hypothetical protein P9209_16215 [Prescottella defluvii]|nr:hypothetical protein P9209_16215 [Prescottella defluvii]
MNLHGTTAETSTGLHVVADDGGRWITVQLTGTVPAVRGLDRVRGLRIGAIENLDVADVAEYFPSIAWLHLFGAPGLLDNLDGLQALPRLATLWICDLFGYGPTTFPARRHFRHSRVSTSTASPPTSLPVCAPDTRRRHTSSGPCAGPASPNGWLRTSRTRSATGTAATQSPARSRRRPAPRSSPLSARSATIHPRMTTP